MPTYDYHCEKCGKDFEIWQSMNDKRLTKCPDKKCGGKIQRKIGVGAGFMFKGTGFYITDYRSESYKAGAKSESSAAAASSGSGESKGATAESKPAADSKPAAAESKPAAPEKKPAASSGAEKSKPKKAKTGN